VETGQYEIDELVRVYNRMIEHLRQERRLQEEQHYFLEKLIQTSPIGILILDFDGHFANMNPEAARMLGMTREELLGKNLGEMHNPLVPAIAALETGHSLIFQSERVKKFKIQKASFVDKGFSRAFVTIEELTQEILQAEKQAYGKVIRMMAHEVNNTLGAVNSILDTAQNRESNPQMRHALQAAHERNLHLAQFMIRFAEVIRLPEPRRETIDARELLQKAGDLLHYLADERQISLVYDLPEQAFLIQADRPQMEQVLVNALKNAIEAMESPGTITLRADQQRRTLQIIDEGIGIPAELAPKLFSPFFSSKNGGQGIGLTLIREILSAHGFGFSLRNGDRGGAVFEVEQI
jgi:two-component system, NtrC family, nitrogen regulation sensor histidine kinase NtrY